jgi:sulfatase modifying factor 1
MACCNLPNAVGANSLSLEQNAAVALTNGALAGPTPFVDIAWFDGGESWVGTDTPEIRADGEGPRRKTRLRPFGIERYAVTNQRYGCFVAATGYRTDAERFGWSYVFAPFAGETAQTAVAIGMPWWRAVEGAHWAQPEGPRSTVAERQDHPAVHLSWNDAAAFAVWCGGRLPSEAEWEYAARGGSDARRFPWGDQEPSDTSRICNVWQGRFPVQNTDADGFTGTAPVDAYAPNPAGLHNCCGNVWEWCNDPFRVRLLSREARQRDAQATKDNERVLKGGSYLCHRTYCYRYRIAARTGRARDTAAGHTGMRVVYAGRSAAKPTPATSR